MKVILFIFSILLVSSNSIGQELQGAIELSEINIMYRWYNNKIEVAVSNVDSSDIVIECTGCKVRKAVKGYDVRPTGRSKELSLSIYVKKGDNDSTFIKTVKYRVSNLPDPYLYWGKAKDNTKANSRDFELFAKYPPEIPLDSKYKILDWTLETPTDTISGRGSNISSAQEILKKITKPTKVTLVVTVIGSDGIRRKRNGSWDVDPWDK